jgi:hypothetical protein
VVTYEVVNQLTGNANLRWNGREFIRCEPSGVIQFFILEYDLSASILAGKSDHQRMRKWPGLAPEITDIIYPDANFLLNLTSHSLLESFPGFDETCQHAVEARRVPVRPGQKELVIFADRNDDCRRDARVTYQPAIGTLFSPISGVIDGFRATVTAILVVSIPLYDLKRPAGYAEFTLVQ